MKVTTETLLDKSKWTGPDSETPQRDLSEMVLDLFEHTDWPLLRHQKAALLRAIEAASEEEQPLLDGLLNFIDAVTDAAYAVGYDREK